MPAACLWPVLVSDVGADWPCRLDGDLDRVALPGGLAGGGNRRVQAQLAAGGEAVLGGAVEVPTLDGLVKMTVPPGLNHGKRLRLANKGYPTGKGDRGDQLVEIQIAVPKNLTAEEKELYEKLRQIESFKPRNNLVG